MKQQFKILLATDYSEEVMNSERYAVQFAEQTNAVLTIVHVYEIPFNS
ncbi:MAG: universal stress protein, partial [Bacteroidetes bacterium]|nr:universal stress protein [Bacteroidota bacterium]